MLAWLCANAVALATEGLVVTDGVHGREMRRISRVLDSGVYAEDGAAAALEGLDDWGGACAVPVDGRAKDELAKLAAEHDKLWLADGAGALWRYQDDGWLERASPPRSAGHDRATLVVARGPAPGRTRRALADIVEESSIDDPAFADSLRQSYGTCVAELPREWKDAVMARRTGDAPLYVAFRPGRTTAVVWRVVPERDQMVRVHLARR